MAPAADADSAEEGSDDDDDGTDTALIFRRGGALAAPAGMAAWPAVYAFPCKPVQHWPNIVALLLSDPAPLRPASPAPPSAPMYHVEPRLSAGACVRACERACVRACVHRPSHSHLSLA